MRRSKLPKRYPPAAVQRLIDLANCVPPDVKLPIPRKNPRNFLRLVRSKVFRKFHELHISQEPPIKFLRLREVREDMRSVKRDKFLTTVRKPNAPKTFDEVVANYMALRDTRMWLRAIAIFGTLPPEQGIRMTLPPPKFPPATVHCNNRGQLQFNFSHLAQTLQNVPAWRIRKCQICGLILWAARSDKLVCAGKCADILRSRRWRTKYKGKYKLHRVKRAEKLTAGEQQRQLGRQDAERAALESVKAVPLNKIRRSARPGGLGKQAIEKSVLPLGI